MNGHMNFKFAVMSYIHHCCVYSEKLLIMGRGTVLNMWNFYSKNKFEKLVHLFGFIIGKITALCNTIFRQAV